MASTQLWKTASEDDAEKKIQSRRLAFLPVTRLNVAV